MAVLHFAARPLSVSGPLLDGVDMFMDSFLMRVIVIFTVFTMDMTMFVGMRMGMDVYRFSMTMWVSMCMVVNMGVLQFDGIFYHKIGTNYHYSQGKIKLKSRALTQNQHTKCHP